MSADTPTAPQRKTRHWVTTDSPCLVAGSGNPPVEQPAHTSASTTPTPTIDDRTDGRTMDDARRPRVARRPGVTCESSGLASAGPSCHAAVVAVGDPCDPRSGHRFRHRGAPAVV